MATVSGKKMHALKTPKKEAKPEKMAELDKGDDLNKLQQGTCCNCGMRSKCRRRSFSEQAWTVLLLWNEINPNAVDQPICEECYTELRDVLIDRNSEIEHAMQQSEEVARIKQEHLSNIAS